MDNYEETMDQATEATRNARDTARDVAGRAGAWMQSAVGRASDRAQDLARGAGDRVSRITGVPVESWSVEARRVIREHPLQAIAIAVGLGYVVGKALR